VDHAQADQRQHDGDIDDDRRKGCAPHPTGPGLARPKGRPDVSDAATPTTGRIWYDGEQPVATVCLDRPAKHNALTPEMLEQLEQILIHLDAERSVRAVLVTAAGNRSFCAGADIQRFKALHPLDMWAQ